MSQENRETQNAEVDAFMRRLAGTLEEPTPRNGRAMWVRMQIEQGQRLAQRAHRMRRRLSLAAKVALLAGAGVFALNSGQTITSLLQSTPTLVYAALALFVVIRARLRSKRST